VAEECAKIRAFFAVALDAAPRRVAAAWARTLRARPGGAGVRWVGEESLHVTLRFLGSIERERVPELVRRVGVETAALEPFELTLGAAQRFPSERRPRVIALNLAPLAPLEALAGAVERGVVAAGCAPEERHFHAHLTLGRVKQRSARRLDVTAPDTGAGDPRDMAQVVAQVVLFRSELLRSGARYTPLECVPLGAPGGSDHP
jgi:2'-5' RNA ligase